MSALSVYTTFPNEEVALNIITLLVHEKLIACANRWPIQSSYIWEGEIVNDQEIASFLKTNETKIEELVSRLTELHPYETPAIIQYKITANLVYNQWVNKSLV